MFRAILCSSSGGKIVFLQHLISSLSVQSALNRCTARPLTESDDTRYCKIQFLPPEDEHNIARNVSRYLMQYVYYRKKELCNKLVIKTSLYYDARSEKHQILYARSHSCEKCLLASSYLSVCPYVSARLPMDGVLWNLNWVSSMKICRDNPNLVKIGTKIPGGIPEGLNKFCYCQRHLFAIKSLSSVKWYQAVRTVKKV
jgi:hypothetical protein